MSTMYALLVTIKIKHFGMVANVLLNVIKLKLMENARHAERLTMINHIGMEQVA